MGDRDGTLPILQFRPGAVKDAVIQLGNGTSYIIVSGLILDGINGTNDVVKITQDSGAPNGSNHIRLQNCQIVNAYDNGILISDVNGTAQCYHVEVLDCSIHDNRGLGASGGAHYHGIYTESSYGLFVGNDMSRDPLAPAESA